MVWLVLIGIEVVMKLRLLGKRKQLLGRIQRCGVEINNNPKCERDSCQLFKFGAAELCREMIVM